ncbi:MAG: hypothetical protein ACOYD0_04885 [Candidatus Nanopelagicales bacterium]
MASARPPPKVGVLIGCGLRWLVDPVRARWTQAGLIGLVGFHLGQLAFGGVLWIWAPLMLVTLVLDLRAERHYSHDALPRFPLMEHPRIAPT